MILYSVMQGHKEWLAEVQFLGIVEHPNLVKLIGYCCVDGERGIQRLLVYEYMPNKSLEDHLFGRALQVLPWVTRLQIILGAAQGLAYLHSGLEVQVRITLFLYFDWKYMCIYLLLSTGHFPSNSYLVKIQCPPYCISTPNAL